MSAEGGPAALRLYRLAAHAAEPFTPALLKVRARRGKEDRERLGERLGQPSRPRPDGRLAWLHGVSVGESLSLLPLIELLYVRSPKTQVLVTSGTPAAALVLASRLPPCAIHQYAPVDTPGAVSRFVGHWRPQLAVFAQSELWPNLILGAKAAGSRLALVSASVSERSLRRWRRAPAALAALLARFDLILARDEAAAAALQRSGARIEAIADLKFGAAPLPADEADLARLRAQLKGRIVIVATSTHAGEERLILEAFEEAAGSQYLLVLAPRHPHRGSEIAAEAAACGFMVTVRSQGGNPAAAQVHVVDGLGELGLWYRLARLAVIGGSFAAGPGGHNPLEPARLACPFVAGRFVAGWPLYAQLQALGATRLLASGAELAETLRRAGAADAFAAEAAAAAAFVRTRDEQTRVALARLADLLER